MPLFSHKNKHATDAPITGAASGLNSRPHESTNLNATNGAPGNGTHPEGVAVDDTQGRYGNEGPGAGQIHGTTVGGVGTGAGANNAPPANTIPPANVLKKQNQSRGGGGQEFVGEVERKVGTLIGSNSLKAKGLQKEQEANSFKVQGAELAEAERLEREALMRRERAVGHGAHPDNKHHGAGLTSPPDGARGVPGGF